jgi:hypothetical protein
LVVKSNAALVPPVASTQFTVRWRCPSCSNTHTKHSQQRNSLPCSALFALCNAHTPNYPCTAKTAPRACFQVDVPLQLQLPALLVAARLLGCCVQLAMFNLQHLLLRLLGCCWLMLLLFPFCSPGCS